MQMTKTCRCMKKLSQVLQLVLNHIPRRLCNHKIAQTWESSNESSKPWNNG